MPADHAPTTAGQSVALEGVTKTYGSTTVLHGVDLALDPGELLCLLGPSGCGKTTALRCIAGLEAVSAGRVRIGGQEVTDVPVHRRDIGMVFQQYSLFPHLSVAKNVEFGLDMRRVAKAERRTRVGEMLEIVGLSHLAERFPHELSGGQQQRVALARALVTRPRALLLDEPLSALDAKVRVRLREQIRAIQTELGMTCVFVTHDQEEALAISDRVAVMEAGRIAQLGTPEELYRRPASSFVADFVGLSNRIDGELSGERVLVHGAELPVLATPSGLTGVAGARVTAYVRPEHVRLGAAGNGAGADGADAAVVLSSGFLGPIRRTVVQFADGSTLAAQHGSEAEFRAGERVAVAFAPEAVTVAPRI
ncbi:ABC transporter ATP-binding protein [Leucobacter luti]|uniref:ABC-type quaternary amine transporter n=1 Tax=Leucobacter luti TaxID=340320 RepID=A0A4Q7TZS3_9MICO|nr:ABC transporter ATP-binding protein [Leucobacter luti]MBL3699133.1 ABC transporter ATP-binding protein [Leucobacter luti]RZT66634.1 putative spermidine/putrescine transport system ATP-binding protein [Leucobacter luti]